METVVQLSVTQGGGSLEVLPRAPENNRSASAHHCTTATFSGTQKAEVVHDLIV